MLEKSGVTYRNLQEQVQKNKDDIEALVTTGETLSSFGLKVVGNVETEEDLPNPGTYQGDYGDAYLIGTEKPYDMSIFTRPFGESVVAQWVNIGQFPAKGEKGDTGATGATGANGNTISVYSGEGSPVVESYNVDGDLYIDTTNNNMFWKFNGGRWIQLVGLKGDQGIQGIQGIQGATGTTLSIVAKLASTDLLPTNFESGLILKNSAYLIPDSEQKNHLWIILGEQGDYSTWRWYDSGDFNLGSVIYKDDVFQYSLNVETSISETDASQTNVPTSYAVALEVDRQVQDLYDDAIEPIESDYVKASELINKIYPVGSIYMSYVSTSPATLFGGTWEQIKDRFLLSAGDTYNAGITGGESSHTLTINEIPSHRHAYAVNQPSMGGSVVYNSNAYVSDIVVNNPAYSDGNYLSSYIGNTGGSQPHNNMPPYLTVYMWKRTG